MARLTWLRIVVAIAATMVIAVVAISIATPVVWSDLPVPERLAGYIDDARKVTRRHIDEIRFVHLRVEGVRCRRDGGTIIVFEQIEAPYQHNLRAYAVSRWPPAGWDGAVNVSDVATDPEVLAFLGEDEVSCETNPAPRLREVPR